MKITKSELKEMIREALREELKTNRYALTESSNEAAETLTYIEKLWAKKAKEQDDTFDDVFGSESINDDAICSVLNQYTSPCISIAPI